MLIQLLFVMLAAVNIAAYFLMWKEKSARFVMAGEFLKILSFY